MKIKVFALFIIYLLMGTYAMGQDIILKHDGETIEALIVDISPGVIKYKKFDKPNGSVYSITRDQVQQITYQNGKILSFEIEEQKVKPIETDTAITRTKTSARFGWHLGLGASSLYGDISEIKALLASAIGASITLPIGQNNTLHFGLDILSVGCGINDFHLYDNENNRWEFMNATEDLGYVTLVAMDRYFLNAKHNYYLEGGGYGSFLMNATLNSNVEIYSPQGAMIDSGPYSEKLFSFYKSFDFGLVAGLGGRIPLGSSGKWHLTAGARFYYGLTNIVDSGAATAAGLGDYSESNIFGLIFVGVDIPTNKKE